MQGGKTRQNTRIRSMCVAACCCVLQRVAACCSAVFYDSLMYLYHTSVCHDSLTYSYHIYLSAPEASK